MQSALHPSGSPSHHHRVLLVDDDAISLEILALMLGCDGYEVLKAADGASALDLLAGCSEQSPDVLLVDMQMPGLSGRELAEKVRATRGSKPLLLAMSATAVSSRQLRDFDGFLLKPLALDDLRQALQPKKQMRKPRAQARPPQPSSPGDEEGIDRAVLSKLRSAMPAESLRELYAACLGDSRARVLALRDLVRAGRFQEIPRGAHQIKGAASMVGASRIARLASALELGSCKEEATRRLLDDLLAACDELERILQKNKLMESK